MTFYLKAADGSISTPAFQAYAECRLRYLAGLRKYENGLQIPTYLLQYADCLVEGSAKDRVSHFALRSVSLLHPPLHSFLLKKEKLLFTKRLLNMEYPALKQSLMILRQQLREFEELDGDHKPFFQKTRDLLQTILKKRCLEHIPLFEEVEEERVQNQCPLDATKPVIGVPFEQVLSLVADREIELNGGLAFLRCDQIPQYLTQLFGTLLEYSSKRMTQTACIHRIKSDPRFRELLKSLTAIYEKAMPLQRTSSLSLKHSVTFEELDNISKYFPPCMRAIHYTLRTRHRLCHTPRVQYTLYLKEIGLPVGDFLKLLEMEYSRTAVQTDLGKKHTCEHFWARDSKKYIYGTKRLYGMEGAKDYSAHACRTIQNNTPGPNHCGGCPFAHFDKENLKQFLTFDLEGKDNAVKFMQQINYDQVQPIEACHLHLRFKLKHLVAQGGSQHPTQEMRVLENSQVKLHSMLKPKHYFSVMSKLALNR